MCRFIAVISTKEFDPEPYLQELKRQAKEGRKSPHRDGWGLWLKNHREIIYKDTMPIWERIIRFPRARLLMAHARKRGKRGAKIALENTHPFIHGSVVFMHNGMVEIERHLYSKGDTDSESYFLHLLDLGILDGVRYIAQNYRYTSLNSVLYKNGKLYVIRVTPEGDDYHTIFLRRENERIVISTEGDGELLPNKKMVIITQDLKIHYRNIFPGKSH